MKIFLFGIPGSGKTTTAKKLSSQLQTPIFHVDKFFFLPGKKWVERPFEDFIYELKKELEKPSWIIDGNSMKTLEGRFKKGDVAIFLSLPLYVCYYRVFKRAFMDRFIQKPRTDRPEGATALPSFRLLKYMWHFRKKYMQIIQDLSIKYPKVQLIHITSLKDQKNLLPSSLSILS